MNHHYSADDCERDEIQETANREARNHEAAEGVIEKAGKVFPFRRKGGGSLLRLCLKPCCIGKTKWERFSLLPCLCHGMIHECTCPLRDKACQQCRKVYLRVGATWYEIDDPHAKT